MILACKDGKRHWWPLGWVCDKCGLTRVEYEEAKKPVRRHIEEHPDDNVPDWVYNGHYDCGDKD